MRLDRAKKRLDRRYPEDPSKPAVEEQSTGRDVSSRIQEGPRQQDDVSQNEELKCPTSEEEEDAVMQDYEAASAGSDDEMQNPVGVVDTLEVEILQLVEHLGGSREKYSRKQHQANQSVTEVYSPPRVTEWAKRLPSYGIVPGLALDITTRDDDGVPWDFDIAERRQTARRLIAEQKPLFLVGSPMCTAFSTWQRLNATRRDPKTVQKEYIKAMVHLEFVCQLYRDQVAAGRYFLHEQPASNSSWHERCITALLATDGVDRCVGDQCCYEQRDRRGGAVKKPTGWMSNSPEVLRMLSRRCQGRAGRCSETGEPHVECSGQVAREAAIYPAKLCKAIL